MTRTANIAAITLMLAGCDASAPQPNEVIAAATSNSPMEEKPTTAAVDAAVKAIKAEASVIDLVHADGEVFQWVVGMRNDGTRRHGFAQYLCSVLTESGVGTAGQAIRIVDYNKYIVDGDGRASSMGAVDCQTGQHVFP